MRIALPLALAILVPCAAFAQPAEAIDYSFTGGVVANAAVPGAGNPTPALGAMQVISPTGPCPNEALLSNSAAGSNWIDSGWNCNLGTSSWTVGFHLDLRAGMGFLNYFQYVFGCSTAASFRCFTDGAAGNGNITLRGGGVTNVNLVGGASQAAPVHVVFVYDNSTVPPQIRAYLNGALGVTVNQAAGGLNINGTTNNLTVGGYNGAAGSCCRPGVSLDDFRVYRRAITPAEIAAWAVCSVPSPEYQVNQAGSSLDVDGSTNTPLSPMAVNRCAGYVSTVNFASTSAAPWDLAVTIGAGLVPASGGAITTANGQIVNMNLAHPSLTFLFGLSLVVPFSPLSLPFAIPPVPSIEAQMVNVDPANPDGFSLSAAANIITSAATAYPVAGPTVDDSAITVTGCPNITFYGTVRPGFNVISNGRVTFGAAANTDFSPTVAEAQGEQMVGSWMDLNPSIVGSGAIDVTNPAPGLISVNYNNVGYFGTTGAPTTNAANFQIVFDTGTGAITLAGLSGIQVPTLSPSAQFLGISPGGGASDPGSTNFTSPGVVNGTGNQMIYQFSAAVATPAVNTITFLPVGSNYSATF